MWHRPADCDIIPLAKLQTLKQNTEVKASSFSLNLTGSSTTGAPVSDAEEDRSSLLSPGKRRLKKQVQKHRRKVSEVQTETDATTPLARFLPTSGSTDAIISASSYAQTSPLPSPRYVTGKNYKLSAMEEPDLLMISKALAHRMTHKYQSLSSYKS